MLLRRRAALPQRWLLFGRPLLVGAVITSACRFSSSSTSSASSVPLPKDHHDQPIPPSSKRSDGGAPPSSRIPQEVAESIHLMSIDGFEWIDFVARPEAMESILHDGGFVLATRSMLHQHGIAHDVVARVSRDVWLPITHFSGDAESIAIVTRVPSSHGDKVSTGFVWAQGVSNSVKQEINKRGGGGGGGDDTDDTTTEENHGETTTTSRADHSDDTDRSQENKDMTILGLTVRLNIFIHRPSKKIITVHRYPLKFIMELQRDWHLKHRFDSIHTMLFRLMQGSTKNFEERQVEYSRRLDWLESTLFREDEEAARRDRVGLDDDVVVPNFRSKRGAHVSLSSSPRSQGATSDNRSRRHAAWSVVRNVLLEPMIWLQTTRLWWSPSTSGQKRINNEYHYHVRFMQHERDKKNLQRSMWWSGGLTGGSPTKRKKKGSSGLLWWKRSTPTTTAAHVSHQLLMGQLQMLHRQSSATVRVLREVESAYRAAALALAAQPMSELLTDDEIALLPEESREVYDLLTEEYERRSDMVHRRVKHLRGQLQGAIFLWEGLRDQSQSLLSLQVSVAVSRLEELLRYLTVFSTIFIPLELVTSFFGMNFVGLHQLERDYENGQWVAVGLMVLTALWTQWWIRRTTSNVTTRGVVY